MTETSLAAVLEAPHKIALREFPVPEIGPNEGLLKVEMVGICSTDVKVYQGKLRLDLLPLIMGHEMVGRVAKVGSVASRKWGVSEGDRVFLEGHALCGSCEPCFTGNYRFCKSPLGYGLSLSCDVPPHLWGGYSQYMYMAPGSVVKPISKTVDLKAAVLIAAVLGNGVQWVSYLGQFKPGETILIQGMGSQGLGATVAAREAGAKQIIISGLSSDGERASLARQFGADHIIDSEQADLVSAVKELTKGRGVDLVIDVTGSPSAFGKSLEAVREQGTVVLAGATGNNLAVPVVLDQIMRREIRLQGAFTHAYQATSAALSIAESGNYPLEQIVQAEYPLSQCQSAMEVAAGKSALRPLKVVLKPWE